ncbi:GAF domain-containing protein [Gracilimonas mengyeensis]|uniref:GAF domain-containing protein n=1 Tax=Gracilimonas mengyeensis TaxID=1302730 RepID=A0A521CS31_9BACT|nr:GAF domain-containing protein [Gracilimonas mengyeensis]SMO62253.1 GAF domain-containing protein [Gracilimonas mengyeensis]
MSTAELTSYETLVSKTDEILNKEVTRDEKLFAICELLADNVDTFDWVGFYMADPEGKKELVLGPFVGPATDHKRIPFGRGICGQVAESHETFVSQDVKSEENYLSCSVSVQSEIVVPIMKGEEFVAQLDIDSNTKGSITDEQQKLLEEICEKLSREF